MRTYRECWRCLRIEPSFLWTEFSLENSSILLQIMAFTSQGEMDRNARKWLAILSVLIVGLSVAALCAAVSYYIMEGWLHP